MMSWLSFLYPITILVFCLLQVYFGHRHIQAQQAKKLETLERLALGLQDRFVDVKKSRLERSLDVQDMLIQMASGEQDEEDSHPEGIRIVKAEELSGL